MNELSNEQELQDLVNQITKLVESSKASIAANVNTIITETYRNSF